MAYGFGCNTCGWWVYNSLKYFVRALNALNNNYRLTYHRHVYNKPPTTLPVIKDQTISHHNGNFKFKFIVYNSNSIWLIEAGHSRKFKRKVKRNLYSFSRNVSLSLYFKSGNCHRFWTTILSVSFAEAASITAMTFTLNDTNDVKMSLTSVTNRLIDMQTTDACDQGRSLLIWSIWFHCISEKVNKGPIDSRVCLLCHRGVGWGELGWSWRLPARYYLRRASLVDRLIFGSKRMIQRIPITINDPINAPLH